MKTVLLAFILLISFSCKNSKPSDTITDEGLVSLPSGLKYRVIKEGQGRMAKEGDTVLIRETARYRNNTILFSNEEGSTPIPVLIGGGQATKGEDEGLRGMMQGEIRDMIIPPSLSKRTSYPPNLSPDSIIVVKVIVDSIL